MTKQLLPYGIWFYGSIFDELESKIRKATGALLYTSPVVSEELSILANLADVKGFESVGEWARNRKRVIYVMGGHISSEDCKIFYEHGF